MRATRYFVFTSIVTLCACFGPHTCCGASRASLQPGAGDDPGGPIDNGAAAEEDADASAGGLLLDDMVGGTSALDGPLVGFWYTYSDGTGRIESPQGSKVYKTTTFLRRPAREFQGGGQSIWGAGFGFDLNDALPPGADPGEPAIPRAFDASDYTGLRFDGVSRGRQLDVRVAIADGDTDPHGGVCDPHSNSAAASCGGHYGSGVQISNNGWHRYIVWFSQLSLPRWSELAAARHHGFLKKKIYAIHFQIESSEGAGLGSSDFDVFVTNVFLTRAPAPAEKTP